MPVCHASEFMYSYILYDKIKLFFQLSKKTFKKNIKDILKDVLDAKFEDATAEHFMINTTVNDCFQVFLTAIEYACLTAPSCIENKRALRSACKVYSQRLNKRKTVFKYFLQPSSALFNMI